MDFNEAITTVAQDATKLGDAFVQKRTLARKAAILELIKDDYINMGLIANIPPNEVLARLVERYDEILKKEPLCKFSRLWRDVREWKNECRRYTLIAPNDIDYAVHKFTISSAEAPVNKRIMKLPAVRDYYRLAIQRKPQAITREG